jgi:hypothetical protein
MRAADTARSAQSKRRRGLARRGTRDLVPQREEFDVIARGRVLISGASPTTCWIQYSRSDTAATMSNRRRCWSPLVSTCVRFWNPRRVPSAAAWASTRTRRPRSLRLATRCNPSASGTEHPSVVVHSHARPAERGGEAPRCVPSRPAGARRISRSRRRSLGMTRPSSCARRRSTCSPGPPPPIVPRRQRSRRHSAHMPPTAPVATSSGMGRQHPQPLTDTSAPRRVRCA